MNTQHATPADNPQNTPAAPEGFYEAELKTDLRSADVGRCGASQDVEHRWGYSERDIWQRQGARCFITYQPAYTGEGMHGTYTIEARWWVYFNDYMVMVMTPDAAKKFLKTRRVSGRAVRNDAQGKRLEERYQWEMSR